MDQHIRSPQASRAKTNSMAGAGATRKFSLSLKHINLLFNWGKGRKRKEKKNTDYLLRVMLKISSTTELDRALFSREILCANFIRDENVVPT